MKHSYLPAYSQFNLPMISDDGEDVSILFFEADTRVTVRFPGIIRVKPGLHLMDPDLTFERRGSRCILIAAEVGGQDYLGQPSSKRKNKPWLDY